MTPRTILPAAAVTWIALAGAAAAHVDHGGAGGFISGFTHPILGWDHVAAMVAVGLWGHSSGARRSGSCRSSSRSSWRSPPRPA
jgi:hydrogenase/urease accessory protein HupE